MDALTFIYKYRLYNVIAIMTVINDMFQTFQKKDWINPNMKVFKHN